MLFPKKRNLAQLPAVRRLPGQSIRDAKERLTDNSLIPVLFSTAFCWLLWFVIQMQVWQHRPPEPKVYLCVAIVATGYATIKLGRLLGVFRTLNRGERGEMVVAEQLEELRAQGFHCFHDLIQNGFNIDHVVVGPAGVFVIETKFRSGSGVIEFRNGQGIFVGGREEERDPLRQARGNAREMHEMIRRDTGLDVWVKGLVVFVGHWKVKNAWQSTDVQVLTAGRLGRYFQQQDQPELRRSEIQLICSHLKRSACAS